MLPALDTLIEEARHDIEARPQQLFLTGDQIYADDVATGFLHLLTPIGNDLLGSVERLPRKVLPDEGGFDEQLPRERLPLTDEPVERLHFPAGLRKTVVMDEARLTTTDGGNHLLSFGEFCAMHLMVWSNVLWPATLPAYGERVLARDARRVPDGRDARRHQPAARTSGACTPGWVSRPSTGSARGSPRTTCRPASRRAAWAGCSPSSPTTRRRRHAYRRQTAVVDSVPRRAARGPPGARQHRHLHDL